MTTCINCNKRPADLGDFCDDCYDIFDSEISGQNTNATLEPELRGEYCMEDDSDDEIEGEILEQKPFTAADYQAYLLAQNSDAKQPSVSSQDKPCHYFNSREGCRAGEKCKYPHICKHHYYGNCKFGSRCRLPHN